MVPGTEEAAPQPLAPWLQKEAPSRPTPPDPRSTTHLSSTMAPSMLDLACSAARSSPNCTKAKPFGRLRGGRGCACGSRMREGVSESSCAARCYSLGVEVSRDMDVAHLPKALKEEAQVLRPRCVRDVAHEQRDLAHRLLTVATARAATTARAAVALADEATAPSGRRQSLTGRLQAALGTRTPGQGV